MKTLGIQIVAFNEPRFIKPVIKQFLPFGQVVVAVSSKPWHGDMEPDNTFMQAYNLADVAFFNDFENEVDQRNWCMNILSEHDYVLVCHADTFFTKEDMDKIVDFIQTATKRQYDIKTKMYWKDLDTVVQPDPILPAMLIRSDVRFKESIIIEDQIVDAPIVPDVLCHHLSWYKTDEEVKKKILTYHHANEIVPDWYENVWLKDKETDFAPTNPTDYKFKAKYSCPDEIRRYFETT